MEILNFEEGSYNTYVSEKAVLVDKSAVNKTVLPQTLNLNSIEEEYER